MPTPSRSDNSARIPLVVFVVAGSGALLCFAALALGGRDNVLLLQLALFATAFGAASVYRHRTREYGDRPGERVPLELGPPRRSAWESTSTVRLAAALVMALSVLYFLGILALIVSPAARRLL